MKQPVTISDEMLRAIFTKPRASDTRPFLARLLSSLTPVVVVTRNGIKYVGLKLGAKF